MGTGKRYISHVERFVKFCRERYTNPIHATTEIGTEFLREYFTTGVDYSSVNSARSTLSSIIKPVCNVPFENPLWYADFSKRLLISGQPSKDMLQFGMLPKFLLLSSQNQFLQIVI